MILGIFFDLDSIRPLRTRVVHRHPRSKSESPGWDSTRQSSFANSPCRSRWWYMIYACADTKNFHVISGNSSVKINGSMAGLMQNHGKYGKSPSSRDTHEILQWKKCDSMACPPNFALPWSISPGWRSSEKLKVSTIRFQFVDQGIWFDLWCQQNWHINDQMMRHHSPEVMLRSLVPWHADRNSVDHRCR